MANQFLQAKEYANAVLFHLKNNLVMGRLVTGSFSNQLTDKNGLRLFIKRSTEFLATDTATFAPQDIVVGETEVAVDQYRHVGVNIGDLEYIQNFNDLMRSDVIARAGARLAHEVDSYLHEQLLTFNSVVGDFGEAVATPQEFNPAFTRLMEQSVPNDGNINGVLTYEDKELIAGYLIGTDIQGTNRSALERARVPMLSDVNVYATQQVRTLVNGTRAATGASVINGANQNVNYRDIKDTKFLSQTLSIDGLTAGHTIKKGETFTIAGVFAYNRMSEQSNGYLQQFTVLADATADGGGAIAALQIAPAMVVPGTNDSTGTSTTNTAFATVTAAPADNAAIVWRGAASASERVRAVFHKSAINLVSARLITPAEGVASFTMDPETGIGIRYWRGSDFTNATHGHRWDLVFGAVNSNPNLGTRLSGKA